MGQSQSLAKPDLIIDNPEAHISISGDILNRVFQSKNVHGIDKTQESEKESLKNEKETYSKKNFLDEKEIEELIEKRVQERVQELWKHEMKDAELQKKKKIKEHTNNPASADSVNALRNQIENAKGDTGKLLNIIHELESKIPSHQRLPKDGVVINLQHAVLECYRKNPGKTLNCSEEVKRFNEHAQQSIERAAGF
ncbi:hypothetical protein ROZALSC1DRAFT_28067 [Rozella allomycis CSF55]|uniref:Uncharacterized protein n=1 Tax=Rozella allomycis (strain CSF55) TaxID=988480 RepID=A0A075AY93_ROZAC|nr:hypothetical protein O9G_000447 [Rozella allomycis CSF55]RKP20439.1 hypothetical protein ROZALSC1DRAFT_28067 [Rozella allomycis CSF55]|eukprot:EPZ33672.1 hypothetical protein O9G_000447 [Rozella allomycis CSF55]